jgi:hypothetical protein
VPGRPFIVYGMEGAAIELFLARANIERRKTSPTAQKQRFGSYFDRQAGF